MGWLSLLLKGRKVAGAIKSVKPNVPKTKKKATKSVPQQVRELLKAISHEDLIEFVQENSKKDKKPPKFPSI